MKRLFTSVALLLWAQMSTADEMRMAVTTSFDNSGLADVLSLIHI